MPKAIATYPRFDYGFKRKFEELPLFSFAAGGETLKAARIDGQFEISFDDAGEWYISDVWIEHDNGRWGDDGRSRLVNLDSADDERMYVRILDLIEARYKDSIEDQIADELGYLRDAA